MALARGLDLIRGGDHPGEDQVSAISLRYCPVVTPTGGAGGHNPIDAAIGAHLHPVDLVQRRGRALDLIASRLGHQPVQRTLHPGDRIGRQRLALQRVKPVAVVHQAHGAIVVDVVDPGQVLRVVIRGDL
ncbi:MAG: hypothetical protein PVI97_15720, partial [Candidatus Thiodiazotropha sp.]